MFPNAGDQRQMGRYLSMGQVGLEMVVPIGIGIFLDSRMNWSPWGVTIGAVLGLVGGVAHLIHLAGKAEPPEEKGTRESGSEPK
jgi:F0F1-type ATP synthase assembly protein I